MATETDSQTLKQRRKRIWGVLPSDPSDWLSTGSKSRLWKLFVAFWVFYILAPPVMLVFISFDTASVIRIPQEFSFQRFELMLANEKIMNSIRESLLYAVITTVIAPLLALLAVLAYRKTQRKALFIALIVLPLFIPGVVHGVGLLIFFQQLGITTPLIRVSIAHILWAFPFSFLVLLTSSSGITEDLLLASSDLGANEFETFRYVIYPLIKPGIISATIFSFVLSFNEFARTFYLIGNSNTVPTFVWASLQVEFSRELYAVAGSAVMLSLSLIGIGTFYLYTEAKRSQPANE
jgi:spermidine/putrescine transport system permease protein